MKMTRTGLRGAVTRRRVIGVLVVLGVLALVALALRPSPLPVETAVATRGPMQVTLDEEGETRVRDRYVVSAPLAGRVLRIELEPGDPVVANETVVATFRPTPPAMLDVRTRTELQARVAAASAASNRARAEQQRAEAELAQAERDVARSRRLVEAGALAPEQLEASELAASTLRATVEAARASVRAADADLRMARASLISPTSDAATGAPIVLRAPTDGVVLTRLRESESIVPQGEPLLEIGDVSKLEIVADFLSTDAVRIRAGQPVLIERWGGSTPLGGVVRLVEPSGFTKISALGVEEQRVNVIIDFEDPRGAFEQLGDRYRVEVRVVVWESKDALEIPISSLVRDGSGWSVFAVRDGRAVHTPIEIGHRSDTGAEVLEGLAPGVPVIAFPGDDIADGVAVEPRAGPSGA